MRSGAADIASTGVARDADCDPPHWDLIEMMFFAYRDFVRDADLILAGDGFGRAHHRVLYFVTRRPGLTIAELLEILQITKQSLNRVLKDLVDRGYVTNSLGEIDRRQRVLAATARGAALIEDIAEVQSARFSRAFARLGSDAEGRAAAFLAAMMDAPTVAEGQRKERTSAQLQIVDARLAGTRPVD